MSAHKNDLEQRVLETLHEMEDDSYVFPERFAKKDFLTVAVMCVICLAGIILGGFIS